MLSPEYLMRTLLSHLGIDYRLHTTSDRSGEPVREHHLFADEEVIDQVLRWNVRQPAPDVIRVFEGSPPPF